MKMHSQLNEKILYLCNNYGGYDKETKLINHLSGLTVSPYFGKENVFLVETEKFISERRNRQLPTNDIVLVKLHGSVINKIVYLNQMFSGYNNEKKLKEAIYKLDYTIYERKEGAQENVLVLTEDYTKTLQGVK